MINSLIESKIAELLLSNVKFHIGDKILKSGQLILFRTKDFYYIFTFKNSKGELKEYQLPYPFKIIDGIDSIGFSYKIEEFYSKNEFIEFKTKVIEKNKKNKLYDSIVYITKEHPYNL